MGLAADPSRPHPFAHDVDPDVFCRSPAHERARVALVTAARTHTGLLVLLGDPGTGKTAVLHRVARDLRHAGDRVLQASALQPPHEMFPSPSREAPDASGTATPTMWGASFLATLESRVHSEGATVVAVDDAQRLTLTELRFFGDLADAERTAGRRLMVLLVGRPALDVKLARLESDRPDAPAAPRVRLSPLDAADVGAYMAWRLQHVGWRLDELFEAAAVDRVAAYARGLPRMVNQLCYAALHTATEAGLARISASSIEAAAGWLEFDLPRPAELPRERPTERWAREVASAGAILRAGARGTGASVLGSARGVARGIRTGAHEIAIAGTRSWVGARDVCIPLGHGIARGVRMAASGVASAAATLAAGVTGLGAGLLAVGHGVGRAGRAGGRAVAATGTALRTGFRAVGAAVETVTHRIARGLQAGRRGIASAGAMLGAGVAGLGAGLVAAGNTVGRAGRAGGRAVAATGATLRAGFRAGGATVETVAHRIARSVQAGARVVMSAIATLAVGVTGLGTGLVTASRRVGHAARTGARAIASAGATLTAGMASLRAVLTEAGRRVGRGVRTGARGIASAGPTLASGAQGIGTTLAAAGHANARRVTASARVVVTAVAMLSAGARRVGAALVATWPGAAARARTGARAVAAGGATLWASAGTAAASATTSWRRTSRRTDVWVTRQVRSMPPKVQAWAPTAGLAILGLTVVTLVLLLWPISYEPPSPERPPPSDMRQALARPPDSGGRAPVRVGPRAGTRPQAPSRTSGSAAREPVTFATAHPPSDR